MADPFAIAESKIKEDPFIAAESNIQDDPFAAAEASIDRPSAGKLFTQGLRESTPALAARLAGIDIDAPTVKPKGLKEQLLYGAGEYLPDVVTIPLGSGLASLLGGTALKQAGKQIAKKSLLKALPKLAAGTAIEGAAVAGTAEAIHSPLKQKVTKGEISVPETLKDVLMAGAAGAAGDVAVRGLTGAVKAPLKAMSKGLKIKKGIPVEAMDQIVSDADLEATQVLQAMEVGSQKKAPKELRDIVRQVRKEMPLIPKKGRLSGEQRKVLTEAQGEKLKGYLIRKKLREAGHSPELYQDPAENLGSKLLNATENFDRIEQATGIRVGDLSRQGYEMAAQSSHYLKNMGTRIEQLKKKYKIDGEELGKLLENKDIPKGANPIKDEISQVFLDMRQDAINKGLKVGLIEHYLPRRLKLFLGQRTETGIKFGTPKKLDSVLEMKRLAPEATSELYEKDAWKLLHRYAKEVSRIDMMKNLLPEVNKKTTLLRMIGKNASAEAVEKTMAKGMGLEHKAVQKFMAEDFINGQLPKVNELIKMLPEMKKDKLSAFINETTGLMYNSWIGLNPRTLIKQVMQNRLVGSAELGGTWIEKGARLRNSSKYKKLMQEILPSLSNESIDFIEQEGWRQEATGGLKKIIELAKLPSRPGMKAFTGLDLTNRKGAFMAGYLKAMKKGFGEDVIGHLLPSQKTAVLETLQRQGAEEAAKLFGKISSHRINYMYSIFDKPQLLQGELGRFIPFTTWGRNQINRYYGDIVKDEKSIKQIAKRAVYPLLYLSAIELATGHKIPGAHPATSIPATLEISALPAIGRTAALAGMGKTDQAIKQATSILPTVRAYSKIKEVLNPTKSQKKRASNPLARALGVHEK